MLKNRFIFTMVTLTLLSSSVVFGQVKKTVKPAAATTTITPKKVEKEKPYTRWSLKGGGNISVIYLARNVKEKNNEPGYCGGLTYDINNFVRVSTLYTRFRPINIAPTWIDIKANTYESNFEILARFPNKKTLLYPFVGLSYNTYSGFFTGELDYLNLREYYPVNSIVKNQWLGFNLGTGIEHNFGILGLFLDYRMRVGKQETAFNIMDVCYTGGIKVRFPYGKFAKSTSKFFNSKNRFDWF